MRSRRLLVPGGNSFRPKDLVTVIEDSLHMSDPLTQPPVSFTPCFHAEIYAPPHRTIVRAHGEIDMASGGAFRAALIAGLDRRPPLLVVDLNGVWFLDVCGLGILVGVTNRAAHADIPITVIGARPHIYRLFTLTHLIDRLDVHPTPTAARLIPDQRPTTPSTLPAALIAA
jgi:anti-anti-sigma factor